MHTNEKAVSAMWAARAEADGGDASMEEFVEALESRGYMIATIPGPESEALGAWAKVERLREVLALASVWLAQAQHMPASVVAFQVAQIDAALKGGDDD